MIFKETKLSGAFIVELEKLEDERGFFARAWCQQEFEVRGLTSRLVQCNVSFGRTQGTLRGMHYQVAPYEEAKLVRCTRGAIYDVIIDLRPDSPTYKQWMGVELTAENHKMLYVPEGFAHGYQTLMDNTEVFYQVSQFYSPESERGLRYDDPVFGIEWPIDVQVISDKDKSWSDYLLRKMAQVSVSQQAGVVRQSIVTIIAVSVVLFLALYNLTGYPVTWFDEGFTLQVSKTLVRFGVYAIHTGEGFYYFGISNGPTVILPVAAAFWLFGIGLLQARLVMALYLLATVYVFYRLARELGGRRLAWVATALLVVSPGVSLIRYGRQGLGEVPGLFFLEAGLALWFAAWERAGWRRLGLIGLLLGLAMVTKHLYLLILAPTLGLAWLANLVYYRTAPQRVFIVPGLVAAACFALWEVCKRLYLDPATAVESQAMLGSAIARAALVFSPDSMQQSLKWLLPDPYLGLLLPALACGFILALPRQREGQQWGVLFMLVAVNLGWFVVASIGWHRYAFPGLTIASLFVARFFYDLTDGFQLDGATLWEALRQNQPILRRHAMRWAVLTWLAVMIALPLRGAVRNLVSPAAFNAPVAMAAYLNEHVPREALIATAEAEMGFLTDHNYYQSLWDPAEAHDFVQTEYPDYVLVGKYVGFYPADLLAGRYRLVTSIGWYELYAINQ